MEERWHDIVFFSYGDFNITVGSVIALSFLLVALVYAYFFVSKKLIPIFLQRENISENEKKRLRVIVKIIFILLFLLILVFSLPLNFVFFSIKSIAVSVALLIETVLIIQLARLLDWFVSNIFIHTYYQSRDQRVKKEDYIEQGSETSAGKIVQYIVYIGAALLILYNFNLDPLIFQTNYQDTPFEFRLSNILKALLVIFVARLIVWAMTQILLYSVYKQKRIDIGAQYALNQLLSYVVFTIAFIIALQHLGINMNLIWGGAAALLVGLGLGLQQTFNDFFSGLILLFERTVKVGDVLEIGAEIGTVQKIGLRSSTILSRGNIAIVVPNSKIVNENIVNWTHLDSKNRFTLNVGVAYGSDTALVKKLLLQCAKNNPYVIDYPAPFVRFQNFGDSALDFTLYLFSRNFIVIEDIKSDIRFEIDRLFRENNISIPFPQRDVWVRKE